MDSLVLFTILSLKLLVAILSILKLFLFLSLRGVPGLKELQEAEVLLGV